MDCCRTRTFMASENMQVRNYFLIWKDENLIQETLCLKDKIIL